MTITPDGGVDFKPPEGTVFDPAVNQMTVPADQATGLIQRHSGERRWKPFYQTAGIRHI